MLRNLLIMINAFKEEENLAQATERSLKGYVNRQMCFLIDETLCRKIITDIWRRSVQQRDVYEPNKHKDLEEEILVRMEMPYYGQPIRLKVSSGGFVSKLAVRLSWVPINEINQTSKRSPGFMDLNLLITPSLGTEHFVRTEIGSEKYKENGTQ